MSETTVETEKVKKKATRSRLRDGFVRLNEDDGKRFLGDVYTSKEDAEADGGTSAAVKYAVLDGRTYVFETLTPTHIVPSKEVAAAMKEQALKKLTEAERKALKL